MGKHEEIEQNSTLADNWDDKEGYYRERVGEKLYEGRYHVLGGRGKGVFSTVLLCRNTRRQGKIQHEHVAVKVIRANDLMRKEGMKELAILREIGQAAPHGTSHNVRILEHFVHRNHLCLVFEAAEMNLREVSGKDAETHDKEGTQDTSKPKPEEDDFDMFSLDKFSAMKSVGTGDDKHEEIEQNSTLADNWDDKEGYYRERVGEKLYEGRY